MEVGGAGVDIEGEEEGEAEEEALGASGCGDFPTRDQVMPFLQCVGFVCCMLFSLHPLSLILQAHPQLPPLRLCQISIKCTTNKGVTSR